MPESTSGKANEDKYQIIPVPGSGVKQLTVGHQILSISPSGAFFDGTSYSVGGPAISIPGAVVSLAPTSTIEGTPGLDDDPTTDNDSLSAPFGDANEAGEWNLDLAGVQRISELGL